MATEPTEQEIGQLPTRDLIAYVDRYKPALTDKIARARELIVELDEDSSFILVEKAEEETKKAEVLGEQLAYYARHISGRRDWTEDNADIDPTDVLVTETINVSAIGGCSSMTSAIFGPF